MGQRVGFKVRKEVLEEWRKIGGKRGNRSNCRDNIDFHAVMRCFERAQHEGLSGPDDGGDEAPELQGDEPPSRKLIVEKLFGALDADGDGYSNEQEMRNYVNICLDTVQIGQGFWMSGARYDSDDDSDTTEE